MSSRRLQARESVDSGSPISWLEKGLLAAAIVEIPIGVDKFFLYSTEDAELGAVAGINVSLATLSFIGLYVCWFFSLLNRSFQPKNLVLGIPMLLYLATVALSVVSAERKWLAISDLVLLGQSYFFFFYLTNRISNKKDLVFCVGCLALAMSFQGLIMICQKAMGASLYGQRIYIGPTSFSVWADGRTAGTLVSAVLAGSWIAILWLVVFTTFLVIKNRGIWYYLGACLFVGILGLLLTQTRGAVITIVSGLLVIGLALFSRGWLPKWTIGFALAACFVGIIPAIQILQKRVVSGDEGSAASRPYLAAIAFETISKNPIFGYGAGNCHLACLPVANRAIYRSEWYYTIHCKYLLVWVETGVIGLLAFLLVLFNSLRHGLVAWFRRDRFLSPLGLGCFAAISGHMTHMFVDIFNSRPQVQTLWVVMGICAAVYRLTLVSPSNQPERI